MELHARVELMRILVQVIDAVGVETAASALDAMNGITFFEQQFRQIAAVLAGDTGYQCRLRLLMAVIVTFVVALCSIGSTQPVICLWR